MPYTHPELHTSVELLPTHMATMRLYGSYAKHVDVYVQFSEAIGSPVFQHFIYPDIEDPSQWPYTRDCCWVGELFEPLWITPARHLRARL